MRKIPPIAANNLVIGYNNKKFVPVSVQLNFSMEEGKLYGLMGINGIGKSTLLKTVSGLLPPIKGELVINGKDMNSLTSREKSKQISTVLTDKINGSMVTIFELVKMGRYPHTNWQFGISDNDNEIILNALGAVGIAHKKKEFFYKLSDGNKQKVMIAMALAQDTPILMLDEPTAHLDIKNRFVILELLQKLAQENNKTILFSGHDLDYMLFFCDQIMLLTPDKLVVDTPAFLINSGEITKAFELDNLPRSFINLFRNRE